MAIQFERPWLLLLILPAAAFIYYLAKDMIRLVRWRHNTIIFTRSIIYLLIILLLSGIVFEHTSAIKTTLFLVDSSDSIRDKNMGIEFIKEALKDMGKEDEAGIINFGGNSAIEILPDKALKFSDIQTRIDSSYTNLESALVSAQSIMPWENKKRIVLLSDGRENAGNVLKQAKRMKENGYSIDIFPLVADMEAEVQLQELRIPDSVSRNEYFEISLNVRSNISTEAMLYLYTNRTLTGQKKVHLNKGDNQFAFSDKSEDGGVVTYTVEVLPEADTFPQNNALSSFTYVQDIPKIMMVTDEEFGTNPFADILNEDMELTVINSSQVPHEMSEMLKFDAFILDNIPADGLNDKFLANLEIAVSHQGKGLLTTGGDKSYGPGGYYKTPLEKILPVNMDIKTKEEDPSLALILVIDKSGSMASGDYGISKLEMAREAAIRATEVLNQKDTIGVIAFDDAYKWAVKPQKLDNLKVIQDQIASIRPGGGTQILPPLEAAYDSILEMDSKLKHIILLTDGQAEKSGYEPLIECLRNNGITLSTVACGRSADFLLMKALAYGGRGRYYETDEFSDIPKIFAKEVFLAGKKYLTNRTFSPVLSGYSDILKGIDTVPTLDGYVTTTAKNTANIIFESDEGDPVLASWQYGLGRAVAWTPDVHGIWTYDWMSWNDSSAFWKNVVSWLVQQNMSKGYSVATEIEGQQGTITIRAEDNAFMTANSASGTLINPDGTKQDIKLHPSAPGEYKGTFENLSSGVYIADITLTGDEGQTERISTGLIMPYSREYDLLSEHDGTLIQKIAYEGGGRVLTDPKDVFSGQLQAVAGKRNPAPEILILLTLLFMLDIAIRRIKFNPGKWKKNTQHVLESGKAAAQKVLGATLKMPEKKRYVKEFKQNEHKGFEEKESVYKESVKKEAKKVKEDTADTHISLLLEKKRKWKR